MNRDGEEDSGLSGPSAGRRRLPDDPREIEWLRNEADRLLGFFLPASINPEGGFHILDDRGVPLWPASESRRLHGTARMVHCAAIAHMMGHAVAARALDHGMEFLWSRFRDLRYGGYFWSVDGAAPIDSTKQAYGHAFVLLAAATAKLAGHPDADRLLMDVDEILMTRFWDGAIGASTEEYGPDWSQISAYRGQNANMHLTEALMAAFDATGEMRYRAMANDIADLIINRHAREQGWRVAEHFDVNWSVDKTYCGTPLLRPAGVTPGHGLEWSRLLVQLWETNDRAPGWMPEAAAGLFAHACATGWDSTHGGFYYTLDWQDRPLIADRYWWPACEAMAAASVLGTADSHGPYEEWYGRIRAFIAEHFIDHSHGGWFTEIDQAARPVTKAFNGKPDLYHALQACLIPALHPRRTIAWHHDRFRF